MNCLRPFLHIFAGSPRFFSAPGMVREVRTDPHPSFHHCHAESCQWSILGFRSVPCKPSFHLIQGVDHGDRYLIFRVRQPYSGYKPMWAPSTNGCMGLKPVGRVEPTTNRDRMLKKNGDVHWGYLRIIRWFGSRCQLLFTPFGFVWRKNT